MKEIKERLLERSPAPWSYYDYMDVALYDEKVGYYMKEEIKLGKEGDFYTSNHVHPVFQKTFARFFLDIFHHENMERAICEWGAGDGRFAKNVLQHIKETDETVFNELSYYIIESSPYHRNVLKDTLIDYKKQVHIFSDMAEARDHIPYFEGIIFSNELIDAMPVYIVERDGDDLLEIKVDYDKNGFHEVKVPCENEDLIDWLFHYGPPLQDGFRTEINLPMKSWLENIATWVQKGMVVTVDYGYTNEELQLPERKEGSLRGYYKHKMIENPLLYSGEMDLTTHIQWDAFIEIAKEQGFHLIYHDQQDRFLVQAGLFTFLQEVTTFNPFSEKHRQNRGIQTLLDIGGISTFFQVNVQGKGLENVEEYRFFNEDPYEMVW